MAEKLFSGQPKKNGRKSAEKAGLKAKHMGEIERFSKDGKGYKFSKHLIIVDWA